MVSLYLAQYLARSPLVEFILMSNSTIIRKSIQNMCIEIPQKLVIVLFTVDLN